MVSYIYNFRTSCFLVVLRDNTAGQLGQTRRPKHHLPIANVVPLAFPSSSLAHPPPLVLTTEHEQLPPKKKNHLQKVFKGTPDVAPSPSSLRRKSLRFCGILRTTKRISPVEQKRRRPCVKRLISKEPRKLASTMANQMTSSIILLLTCRFGVLKRNEEINPCKGWICSLALLCHHDDLAHDRQH